MSNKSKSSVLGWAWTLWLLFSLVALGIRPLDWRFWAVSLPIAVLAHYEARYKIRASLEAGRG